MTQGGVIGSRILGTGSALPRRVVTNAELAERVDTSDEWIVSRSGIRERHIAAADEATSDLSIKAAAAAPRFRLERRRCAGCELPGRS